MINLVTYFQNKNQELKHRLKNRYCRAFPPIYTKKANFVLKVSFFCTFAEVEQ
jgi:hypothetical protein